MEGYNANQLPRELSDMQPKPWNTDIATIAGATLDATLFETTSHILVQQTFNKLTNKVPCPRKGIKLSSIAAFVEECGGESGIKNLTTSEIYESFLKPLTHLKYFYCDYLEAERMDCVGEAEAYVSHSWEYVFLDVVNTLLYHFRDTPDVLIWFDLFSYHQHDVSDIVLDWWGIAQFNHTVLILSPWTTPIPPRRSWFLLDVYCALVSNRRVEIALLSSDRIVLLEAVLESAMKSINSVLATVKRLVHQSLHTWKDVCWNSDEKTHIFNIFNDSISEMVYNWTISNVSALTVKGDDVVLAQKCLGVIYMNRAEWDKADALFKGLCDTCDWAKNDVTTLVVISNYALYLYKRNRLEELLPVCKRCFEMSLELNGYKCIYTRKAMNNLLSLYYRMEMYKEAVQILLDFLTHKEEALGDLADKHYETFQAMNDLGILYKKLERYDDTIRYMTESIAIRKEILGDDHPYTLTSLSILAALYRVAGREDDALRAVGNRTISVSREQSG